MRHILVLLVFYLFLPFSTFGQEEREVIPVNWKEVKEVAEKDPQRIKDLVARLSANVIDTTMTWNERILAYYGQSFLTPYTELGEGRELDKLLNEGKYEECLVGAKEQLKKNPVSLKALRNAVFSITLMARDSTKHYDVSLDEGKVYFNRMNRIFNTIAITGEGTKEKPFYVTAVSDEYLFMNYYLEIWETGSQYLSENFDVFELKETSEYYSRPKIYFEITRVLEIEVSLFQ
ncbi:MAG: DUF4919 domain-containing protein [Prevotella sp.]|jgi:hypothetical protein|nr:DUF4919 domain-containing protein [Prevotella sp.]